MCELAGKDRYGNPHTARHGVKECQRAGIQRVGMGDSLQSQIVREARRNPPILTEFLCDLAVFGDLRIPGGLRRKCLILFRYGNSRNARFSCPEKPDN
jgi:hypothetical protein